MKQQNSEMKNSWFELNQLNFLYKKEHKKGRIFMLFVLLFLASNTLIFAQCTINAGGNATICGTTHTLDGSASGTIVGSPTWTLVSKPSGAPDPVISNPNILNPNVTGMTFPGNYVFQLAQTCDNGPTASQVTIKAPGDVSTFTAGANITNIPATTGTVMLNGLVPEGYTASWSAYNIYNWERSSVKNMENAQFSSTTVANPTFSLIKKANHDVDPAYIVTLKITSVQNPSCSYEKSITVRFIPNPNIIVNNKSECKTPNEANQLTNLSLNSLSPIFSKDFTSSPNSSGNFGTTISLIDISQPAGADIAYENVWDGRLRFSGVTVPGTYKFKVSVSNASGTHTTPEVTYTWTGISPSYVSFISAERPIQKGSYGISNSGAEVRCDLKGTNTPVTIHFTLNPADIPSQITNTVTSATITPTGGAATISAVSGAGADRNVTVTPPSGGWHIGTYRINFRSSNGSCQVSQDYFIHISDNARPDVSVPNTTICYPGSGSVSATVPLPDVYKGVIDASYLQSYSGRYKITLVSKPDGASNPTIPNPQSTPITNTTTTISNLDKEGEYVFKIEAIGINSSNQWIIDDEYACSGAATESEFSIFVSVEVGANAGSDQTLTTTSQTNLNGNAPGVANGLWTLTEKPVGAPDPIIDNPALHDTNVSGLVAVGTYKFKWTITTGDCISEDEVEINNSPIITCSGSVANIPPNGTVNIRGVNVATSSTGAVGTMNLDTTLWGGGVSIPVCGTPGSFILDGPDRIVVGHGSGGAPTPSTAWSITFTFDEPVNDLVWMMMGAGATGNENFVFTSNGGTIAIASSANCYTTINGNEILSGAGAPTDYSTFGGGGIFRISAPTDYTELTISGNGGYNGSNFAFCDSSFGDACYKPGLTTGGNILDTKVGITSLSRAGDVDNWPMVRKGGWIALESKAKGFVPNRVAFDASGNPIGIPSVDFVEGMMVYDTTNHCMKVYTLKEGDQDMAWHCMTTQTCPE